MAGLLIPSSVCCSSPKFLLHSRGVSSSSSLLLVLRSLCSSSHRHMPSKLAPVRAHQHRLRGFQQQIRNPVLRTPVLRRLGHVDREGQMRGIITCKVASEALASDVKAYDAGQIQIIQH